MSEDLYLGKDSLKRAFTIKAETLNQHILILGTTGSGKTTTLYNFLDYHIKCGNAQIVIDGKGDQEFLDNVKRLAKTSTQPFYFFSLTDPESLAYNPFEVGTPGELADKLMSLTDWSEEHYKLSSQRFLQLLFRVFAQKGWVADLPLIVRYLDKKLLLELIKPKQSGKKQVVSAEEFDMFAAAGEKSAGEDNETLELIAALESIDEAAVNGLKGRLGILAEGDHRKLLKSGENGTLTLNEALDQRGIVLFSLDSLKYPEQARLFGKLVVADIKTQVTGHRINRPNQRVNLLFDEFNVFISPNVMDLVTKSRSAGFCIVLSMQGFSDIDRLPSGEALRRQIIQNCNTLIVHRVNDPKDADELASMFGTQETYLITFQINDLGATDLGSMRPEQEFKIHPNDIKGLKRGEIFIKYHNPKMRLNPLMSGLIMFLKIEVK